MVESTKRQHPEHRFTADHLGCYSIDGSITTAGDNQPGSFLDSLPGHLWKIFPFLAEIDARIEFPPPDDVIELAQYILVLRCA